MAHLGDRIEARTLYFSCIKENTEERATVHYLQDVAVQAGLKAPFIYMEDIGITTGAEHFVDLDNHAIHALFKLYPGKRWPTMPSAKLSPS